jgi:hypothetical protein
MAATPIASALSLIRSEYLEMPGLTLKPAQVQRLCGVDALACRAVLDALVETGFLTARLDGSYARTKNADVSRLRPAKATLTSGTALAKTPGLRNSA